MSLDYSLTDIKAHEDLFTRDNYNGLDHFTLSQTTEQLVWATMIVGLNGITKTNVREFWVRLALVQKVMGAYSGLTAQDVKRHIGLWTNATTYKSRRKWERLLLDSEYSTIEWDARKVDWSDNDNVERFTMRHVG